VLVVCHFWDDFKIHAADVYRRYVTDDVSLAVEIVENNTDRDGLAAMKLVEMEKKLAEFGQIIMDERKARIELEKKLHKTLRAETAALGDTIDVSVDAAKQAFEDEIEDFRQEVTNLLEEKEIEPVSGGVASISLGLRTFWNEQTLPSEEEDGKLWIVNEVLPVYRKWIKQTRYPPVTGTSQFLVLTKLLIDKDSIRSLTLDEHLEKLDEAGKLRKRAGFVGRRIAPAPI